MKKLMIIVMALAMMMAFGACSGSGSPETVPEMPAEAPREPADDEVVAESPAEGEVPAETRGRRLTVDELYPFESDILREYEGKGIEFAWFNQYVDFLNETKIQLRENNGGTETVRVLEKKNGVLKEVFNSPETYYKENLLAKMPNTDRVLLMEPIALGTAWENRDEKSEITGVDVEVETPYGKFSAVEVTTISTGKGEAYKNIDYYAEGMGLIKTINSGDGYEVSSSLETFERNARMNKIVNFYYPNAQDERIFLYRKEIPFTTNDIPRSRILEAYRDTPKDAAPVLSPGTKLNYLYLNDDGMVYVDLTPEFISEMNAGSRYEGLILQSFANTLGDYYGAEKVLLTVDGKTYESGHVVFEKFEPIKVNYDSIVDKN